MKGARPFHGEEFVFDGIFTRRQDVYSVALPDLDLLTDARHGPLEVDVGDQIANILKRFTDPAGGDGIDFMPLTVHEIMAL